MNLKSVNTTYEFTPEDIQELIAEKLEKEQDKVSVNYVIEEVGGDPMDRYPGTDTVTKIRVTVKDK
jgi:hypothetical protein